MLVKPLVKLVRSVATSTALLPKASPRGTFSEGPRSHKKFRYLIGISLPLVLWGCQTDDPVVGPQPQPASNLTQVAYRNQQTYDDRMAELADALPGFAGLYLDDNQRLVIQLTNRGDLQLARTKVGEYFMARARGDASRMSISQQQIGEATSRSVKYDFRQLHTWYADIRAKILSLNGVTSGDIDEAQNRIVIGVTDPEMIATVQRQLAQVAAPGDVVLVKSGIYPAKLDVDLRDEVHPVVAGVQINGAGNICTLGYNVAHPEDSYSYFVTAAHCTGVYGSVQGDVFGQPTIARPIGFEIADPPTFTNPEDSRCPSYVCRFSDVALIRYTTSDYRQGHIAWPNNGSRNFTTTKAIDATGDPALYNLVHMVGRTSGHTGG